MTSYPITTRKTACIQPTELICCYLHQSEFLVSQSSVAFQTGCLQWISINQAVFFWLTEICSQDTTHMALSRWSQVSCRGKEVICSWIGQIPPCISIQVACSYTNNFHYTIELFWTLTSFLECFSDIIEDIMCILGFRVNFVILSNRGSFQ